MAQLATNILKITTGRFRPNFYAMCHWDSSNTTPWDGTSNLCTLAVGELEGRQSFPSGHTSCAFSTLAFFSAGAVIDAGCAYAAHSCYFVLFQVDRKHADEDPISTDGYSTLPCVADAVAV
ncbi:hypothetical protein DYB37_006146 [Aphanomyces astaci]|uniref:Phosphatidic acid phosphatase type 2/haloperoxidase domain-containing protein n=1 Tax=Aphanomyces astaci TaxID=112090 RepID=A0A418EH48_APHAT|nr:hypothetical protein DYB35_003165 [Aphanomyces astaci]RHZ13098.1 hypothetical protein DYB37_006146 [Aphanomyces astaci]